MSAPRAKVDVDRLIAQLRQDVARRLIAAQRQVASSAGSPPSIRAMAEDRLRSVEFEADATGLLVCNQAVFAEHTRRTFVKLIEAKRAVAAAAEHPSPEIYKAAGERFLQVFAVAKEWGVIH